MQQQREQQTYMTEKTSNINLPIVVAAYNRPNSLSRLLNSIASAYYPKGISIQLIISIDYSGSNDCVEIATQFEWKHGVKQIIAHKENLGLRNHILSCGDVALKNDGVIVLEDDCFVSKDFYNYALQTFQFYKDDVNIAGISLYSYEHCENSSMPFYPLNDGNDVYFKQVPSSWGQLWTKQQWEKFKEFYNQQPELKSDVDNLPANIFNWPETSWKKYFYLFIVQNNLYFVYPQVAHSTNFGDVGTHFTNTTQIFQVSLSMNVDQQYRLPQFNLSLNKYDAYFELSPLFFQHYNKEVPQSITINTYGTKRKQHINTKYILITGFHSKAIQTFNISMKPLANNILYNNVGEGLSIIKNKDWEETPIHKETIIKHHHPTPYNFGYKAGLEEVIKSRTYQLGHSIKNLFEPFIRLRKKQKK